MVQSGAGKFFNTGIDLLDSDGMSFARGSDFHEINRILILSDKILVAAVNGPAAGYRMSSLALYDLVYSVPDAYFFMPFVKWGMAAEGGSSVSFPRLMGHQKAASLFLAAERISALEAERLGVVSKILPKEGFFEQVMQIAGTIAQSAPGSLRATKEQMRQPFGRTCSRPTTANVIRRTATDMAPRSTKRLWGSSAPRSVRSRD